MIAGAVALALAPLHTVPVPVQWDARAEGMAGTNWVPIYCIAVFSHAARSSRNGSPLKNSMKLGTTADPQI